MLRHAPCFAQAVMGVPGPSTRVGHADCTSLHPGGRFMRMAFSDTDFKYFIPIRGMMMR